MASINRLDNRTLIEVHRTKFGFTLGWILKYVPGFCGSRRREIASVTFKNKKIKDATTLEGKVEFQSKAICYPRAHDNLKCS